MIGCALIKIDFEWIDSIKLNMAESESKFVIKEKNRKSNLCLNMCLCKSDLNIKFEC